MESAAKEILVFGNMTPVNGISIRLTSHEAPLHGRARENGKEKEKEKIREKETIGKEKERVNGEEDLHHRPIRTPISNHPNQEEDLRQV